MGKAVSFLLRRSQSSLLHGTIFYYISISRSDTEDEKAHKIWKKSIMLVWRAAANHKYANVFSHPVTDDIAPGYSSVVFRYTTYHLTFGHTSLLIINHINIHFKTYQYSYMKPIICV